MLFIANNDWEIDNPICAVFGPPESRKFPLFEASFAGDVFLIDLRSTAPDVESYWRRFFSASVQNALQILQENEQEECRIALLSNRYKNNGDYGIVDIIKIIEAKDKSGQPGYVYYCKNGQLHFKNLAAKSVDDLTDVKTLYFASPESHSPEEAELD